jgi:thioredoxin 1
MAFLTGLVLLVTSCRGQVGGVNQTISPDDFQKKLAESKQAQLLDVRTPTEYEEGYIEGAINIDWRSADFAEKAAKLDKSKPVLVYCLGGGRSAAAAAKLREMGFVEVYNLDGGYMKWTAQDKPVKYPAGAAKSSGMSLAEYEKLISGTSKYVLVDFTAKWCRPCQQMKPMLNKLAAEKKDKLELKMVDADENKSLLKEKKIDAIPYFELYKNGKLVWKHQGAIEEADLLRETGL